MDLRPGYKQTEVAGFPEGWTTRRLGNHATFLRHGTHSRAELIPEGPVKYLHYGDIHACTGVMIEPSDLPSLPVDKAKTLDRLRDGDLVISDASEDLTGISKSVEICGVGCTELVGGLHTIVVRFDKDIFADGFKGYLQFCPPFCKQLRRLAAGTKVYATNRSHVANIEMHVPGVDEQRAIATALSDVDALLDGLDELIDKKRALKQAAMQQLLTGATRLPGFEGEWEVKRLGEIGTFLKGSGVTREESRSGPLACVRYGEIYTTHHDYMRTFCSWISEKVAATATRLEQGDLLFAGSGETKEEIGKCVAFLHSIEAYAGGDIVILRQHCADALFLGYALNAAEVNGQKASRGQGDAVVHISSNALAQVRLALPAVDEQTAIATVLSDMDAEIEALEQRRAKTADLKYAMMQELLTGRTRLV